MERYSISHYNGRPIRFDAGTTRVAYSDASNTGFGGYVVELGKEVAQGLWSEDEAKFSSTWRELIIMCWFPLHLSSRGIGYRQPEWEVYCCQWKQVGAFAGALRIFETCLEFSLRWIPRLENEKADFVSRIVDFDDWGIHPGVFQYYDRLWGQHSVDWFASFSNAQLPRFF